MTCRISPSVSTSRPPILGVHCVGEVRAYGGPTAICKGYFNFNLLLYISICLLLHDQPWMLLLRCWCLDSTGLFHCPGLPPVLLGPWPVCTTSRTLQTGSQLTLDPHCWPQPLQGPQQRSTPHRSACFCPVAVPHSGPSKRGLQGLLLLCIRLLSSSYQSGAPCCIY